MADDSESSSVIDDDGRLFGLINIVDALVLLLAVAVVVAGVALLTGGNAEQETRFITVDVGAQPSYIADQVTVGDEWTPQGGGSFVITDVYRAPGVGAANDTQLLVRGQVNGTTLDDSGTVNQSQLVINFAGDPLRFGQTVAIETDQYAVSGVVTAIGQTGEELPTQPQGFVVEATVDRSVANRVETGDRYVVGGTEQLQVETVTVYPTVEENSRRVVMGVTGQTRVEGGQTLYGSQPVQQGRSISLQIENYQLTGDIVTVGSLSEPGTAASRTATVEITGLSPTRANAITSGATEQSQDVITAQVLSKSTEPAEQVVQTGGGFQIIEHPVNLDVTLTVELTLREFETRRLQFRGSSLTVGDDISLALGSIVVDGTVTAIGS